jgi:hypothetical protein
MIATRPSRFWPRALPVLARHVARTMPWATLIAGCLAGTALLAVLAYVAGHSHQALSQGAVRVTFLPAVAALAFVPRDPFRPVAQAAPVPAWLTSAGQILLAVPVWRPPAGPNCASWTAPAATCPPSTRSWPS